MDFSMITTEWPLYLSGLWTTVWMVSLALIFGLLIAVPTGIMRNSDNWLVKGPAWAYVYFFRGTPLLIQLFLIYYGSGQFFNVQGTPFEDAWFCALLAFTLNTGAYTAEIVRGSINTMPKGEIEAAKAYGMSHWQTMRRITLPSSFRRALPAYSNEVIFMLHGSAIAGVVTIVDLTGVARIVNSRYYAPFEAFITSGLLYMCVTFIIVFAFKQWEKRWHRHLRPLESK